MIMTINRVDRDAIYDGLMTDLNTYEPPCTCAADPRPAADDQRNSI